MIDILFDYKLKKKELYTKWLQKIADHIYNELEKSNTEDDFHKWYNLGLMLDMYVKFYFNIRLR